MTLLERWRRCAHPKLIASKRSFQRKQSNTHTQPETLPLPLKSAATSLLIVVSPLCAVCTLNIGPIAVSRVVVHTVKPFATNPWIGPVWLRLRRKKGCSSFCGVFCVLPLLLFLSSFRPSLSISLSHSLFLYLSLSHAFENRSRIHPDDHVAVITTQYGNWNRAQYRSAHRRTSQFMIDRSVDRTHSGRYTGEFVNKKTYTHINRESFTSITHYTLK